MLYDEVQEDERLLGYNNPSKGNPLRRPQNGREMNISSMRHGGPKPINTLHNRNAQANGGLSDIRRQRTSNQPDAYGHSRKSPLQLETSQGSNVSRARAVASIVRSETDNQQSQKRRRLNNTFAPHSNPQSPVETVDLSESGYQKGGMVNSHSGSISSTYSRPPSASRDSFNLPTKVPEYRKVETMMKCSPENGGRRNKNRQANREGRESDSASMLRGGNDPKPKVVDISDDESVRKHIDQRKTSERLKKLSEEDDVHGKVSGEASPYWSPVPPGRQTGQSQAAEQPGSHVKVLVKTPQLREQFVNIDGQRRGRPDRLDSPDELDAPTTVGVKARTIADSPNKKRRLEPPTRDISSKTEETIFVKREIPLEPSRIPSTTFSSNTSKAKNKPEKEAPDFWAADLRSINLPAIQEPLTKGQLGIQLDENARCFKIMSNGNVLHLPRMPGTVSLDRLQKVFVDISGTKVRFSSSMVQHESDHIIDVEFASNPDVRSLYQRLDDTRISLKLEPSDKMEKMFLQRRQEPPIFARSSDESKISDSHKDMSKEVWKKKMSDVERPSPPKTKLVRDLMTKGNSSSYHSASPKENMSDIDKILADFEAQPPPRRTTRTSRPTRNLDDNSDLRKSKPPPEKYSDVYGLGEQWKRPVSYPQIGKKKATVDHVDLYKLDEGEFLNDAIVTFYMRYLEDYMQSHTPEVAKRVYFFSTFFYERLTNVKGKIDYAAVQKWTKDVDIFTYDYLIVPINESWHWYLAIICNLPALDRSLSGKVDEVSNRKEDMSDRPDSKVSRELEELASDPIEEGSESEGARESFADMTIRSPDNHLEPDAPHITDQPLTDDLHTYSENNDVSELKIKGSASELKIRGMADARRAGQSLDDDPGKQATLEQAEQKKVANIPKGKKKKPAPAITHVDPTSPMIITFDSLGSNHGSAIKYLKQYLLQEAEAKRGGMTVDVNSIQGINAKSIPQQNNFSDCGLYMLGYLDRFNRDGPSTFIANVVKRGYSEDVWSFNPSGLRSSLRTKLFELHEQQEEQHRMAKDKKKKVSKEPTPTSPASDVVAQANDGASRPASRQDNPLSSDTTRDEALANAKELDIDSDNMQPDQSKTGTEKESASLLDTAAVSSDAISREDRVAIQEEPSLIVVESQDTEGKLQVPASPETKSAENQTIFPLELPSQIQDSQEIEHSKDQKKISEDSQTDILGSEDDTGEPYMQVAVSRSQTPVSKPTSPATAQHPPSESKPSARVRAEEGTHPEEVSSPAPPDRVYSLPISHPSSAKPSPQSRSKRAEKFKLWQPRSPSAALPVSEQRQARLEQKRPAGGLTKGDALPPRASSAAIPIDKQRLAALEQKRLAAESTKEEDGMVERVVISLDD